MSELFKILPALGKLGSFEFGKPYLLLLLLLVPVLAYLRGKRGTSSAFLYSSARLLHPWEKEVKSMPGAPLGYLRWLTISLIIIAFAQPRLTETETSVSASGVDIMVCIDMSGSMEAMDFRLKGKDINRLEMAKEVLKQFIAKRPSDRIGLVAFAGRPYIAAPLTLDHDFLIQNIERLEIGTIKEQNTAIGSAIMSALNRLKDVQSKSKIVILMTDGQNNAGKVLPITAAEAARALKVKIYTIGVGKRGESYVLRQDFFGRLVKVPQMVDIDEDTLIKVAEITGGKYYRADNAERFKSIYDEIDKLEKTEVLMKKYVRYQELFKWVILAGMYSLLLEIILSQTIYRRLP